MRLPPADAQAVDLVAPDSVRLFYEALLGRAHLLDESVWEAHPNTCHCALLCCAVPHRSSLPWWMVTTCPW